MQEILKKADILTLLHFARQQEEAMASRLSDVERNTIGAIDNWSAKDVIANILLWKQLHTQKLAQAMRGEIPPTWTDMQEVHRINIEGFLRFQHRSFQEIQAEAEAVFRAFIIQVEGISEDVLNNPRLFDWQSDEPLYAETLGNGLFHPCTQLTAFYLKHDRPAQALQLQEALLEMIQQVHLPDEMLGGIIYNQVCFYATNGRIEKALALFPEALRLRPTLLEWSKHDVDLDALRTQPTFQAIIAHTEQQAQTPVHPLMSLQELFASRKTALSPLIVDVRGHSEYAEGHITDAINIPLGKLTRSLTSIPKERPVVTYCNMHHRGESRGERAAAHYESWAMKPTHWTVAILPGRHGDFQLKNPLKIHRAMPGGTSRCP